MDSKVVLKEKNHHDTANFLSKLFFFFVQFSLFSKGYKHGFTLNDLWQIRSGDQSGRLGDRLEEAWMKEVEKCRKTKYRPSLSKAIISCFWFEYMMCGFLAGMLFIIVWPLVPFTLALFIEYFSGEKTPDTYKKAHIYNLAMNISTILTAIMMNHLHLLQGSSGMRVRVAACSLLFRKILKLNRIGISKTESGQVINLGFQKMYKSTKYTRLIRLK